MVTDDPLGNEGARMEGRSKPSRLALVTNVYAHPQPNDDSNYEVDVEVLDSGTVNLGTGAGSGQNPGANRLKYKRIPVKVAQRGIVYGIQTDALVTISYFNGNTDRPYVDGVVYTTDDRAPTIKPGEWRSKLDESVVEVVDDGGRKIRIGQQSDERGDLDFGLLIDFDRGAFEIYDQEGNGLCCDGEGGITFSGATVPDSGGGGPNTAGQQTSQFVNLSNETDSGPAFPRPTTTQTVNLADEGLSSGDVIDPYLDNALDDNTTVVIPDGSYAWEGGGLSGVYENAEVVGGGDPEADSGDGTTADDEILVDGGTAGTPTTTLNQPAGTTGTAEPTIDAGDVHFRYLTINGERGDAPAFDIAVRDPDARAVFWEVHLPGGATGSSAGIRTNSNHSGSLHLRNCRADDFPGGGVDASTTDSANPGRTVVAGGLYQNNGHANVRFGAAGSAISKATLIQDGTANTPRNLWFESVANAIIADCDITTSDSAVNEPPVQLSAPAGDDTQGTVASTRITNDGDGSIIEVNGGLWTGDTMHFTGSGTLTTNVTSGTLDLSGTCSGGSCEVASTTPRTVGRSYGVPEQV